MPSPIVFQRNRATFLREHEPSLPTVSRSCSFRRSFLIQVYAHEWEKACSRCCARSRNARLYITSSPLFLFHKTKMGWYINSQLSLFLAGFAFFCRECLCCQIIIVFLVSLFGDRSGGKDRAKPLPSLLPERESLAAESWSFARLLAVAVLLLP
jgi:hypothetical protein